MKCGKQCVSFTYLESVVPVAFDGPSDEGHSSQGRQSSRRVDALGHAHSQTDCDVLTLQRLAGTFEGAEGEYGGLYGNSLQTEEATEKAILFLQ